MSIKIKMFVCLTLTFMLTACNASMQNALLGVQETSVGEHRIKVTDCYRTDKAQATTRTESPGTIVHRYEPCRDAKIEIRNQELTVNGKPYGKLNKGDAVVVDHGKVLINESERREVAAK